ncbi:hypothetical protein [Cetobacterium sp.]
MKKSINLDLLLIEKINKISEKLGCSRDYILELALDDFIEKSQIVL